MESNVKPGYKTTEFWLMLILTVVTSGMAVLITYGIITTEQGSIWQTFIMSVVALILPLMTIAMNKDYVVGRNALKMEYMNPGTYIGGTLEIIDEEVKELEPLPNLNWASGIE